MNEATVHTLFVVLKAEVRRLGDRLATLQSRLMTADNHHIQKKTAGGFYIRRKSAFTPPRKVVKGVDNTKRHSLQLKPKPQVVHEQMHENTREHTRSAVALTDCMWTSNPALGCYDREVSYPQELNPTSSFLYSVSLHSRNYLHTGE